MRPEEIVSAAVARFPAAECVAGHTSVTLDVPASDWVAALEFARDDLRCGFFDWLGCVDEEDRGFAVVAHLYSPGGGHHLMVRTMAGRAEPRVPTATPVYRGASWHEREAHEMFGVVFDGHPNLMPLLLPDGFDGHPLRKDFVLAARAAKDWPGAREPGEQDSARIRRRLPPPGLPPEWRQQ